MAYLEQSDSNVNRLIRRLYDAGAAVDRALRAPGELPSFRRQDLEAVRGDIIDAMCLLHKLVE
jgi:hypothetical protein